MITIYTIAYNEEVFFQFMIDHYRERFPNCNIVLFDNMSTDNTQKIATQNHCKIITFDTNNKMNDFNHIEIKNNCWKSSETDWVFVCDMDVLLDINEDQLKYEESIGTTLIKSEGYNMLNMEDNYDLHNIKYGKKDSLYSKTCVFNKKFVQSINYITGCHSCDPIGDIHHSDSLYKLYHYSYINVEYKIAKYKLFSSRLSSENIEYELGQHYFDSEDKIRNDFRNARFGTIHSHPNKFIKIR